METGEKILQKAYELFKRYGVRSVTMDEIATQCGVSKKTVYQFFEDKDSLVESIMASVIDKSQKECTMQQQVADNAIHEMFLSMQMVQNMLEGVNPALMYDLRKYHSNAYGRLEEHKHQFMFSFIKKNMERGISEGLYRPDINVDIIAPFQLHCMMIPMEEDIFPRSKYTIIDIDYEISVFLLHGLSTSKGEKLIEKYKAQISNPQHN
jgi:AcrR family transcriptional regulator